VLRTRAGRGGRPLHRPRRRWPRRGQLPREERRGRSVRLQRRRRRGTTEHSNSGPPTSPRPPCSRPRGPCRRAPCPLRLTRFRGRREECVLVERERRSGERERETGRKALFSFDGLFFFRVSQIKTSTYPPLSPLFPFQKQTYAAFPPERRAPVPLLLQAPRSGRRRPERERRLWRQAEGRKRSFFVLLSDLLFFFFSRDQGPETLPGKLGPGSGPRGADRGDGASVDARSTVPEGRAGVAAAALVSFLFLCFPADE